MITVREQESLVTNRRRTRRNFALIADEAHRSQYDFIDGFACHKRDPRK